MSFFDPAFFDPAFFDVEAGGEPPAPPETPAPSPVGGVFLPRRRRRKIINVYKLMVDYLQAKQRFYQDGDAHKLKQAMRHIIDMLEA